MDWPKHLDVVIDYGEENRKETSSKLLQHRPSYGPFGPMAEYETTDGEKYWIVSEYFIECRDKHIPPNIPIEVITRQAEIQRKLDDGIAEIIRQQKQQETGLVLPDAFTV